MQQAVQYPGSLLLFVLVGNEDDIKITDTEGLVL